MELSATDRRLLALVAEGLALDARPFLDLAQAVGISEADAIERLRTLQAGGAIKRLGLIVRHHELGYRANAMVVWDIADDRVDELGTRMAALPFVTLCYRRRRALPEWPYNLFAMIHGTDRAVVARQIDELVGQLKLHDAPRSVLFSRKRFKQRGAAYGTAGGTPAREESWTNSIAAS
jgi:siroheme decarboxylase